MSSSSSSSSRPYYSSSSSSSSSSVTRVYVGNLSRSLRDRDLEDLFYRYYGKRATMKEGFGFIEFDDYRDAQDAVRDMDNINFEGRRLVVQLAKPSRDSERDRDRGGRGWGGGGDRDRERDRESYRDRDRQGNRIPVGPKIPRGSGFKLEVEGITSSTSWQTLKDFARTSAPSVSFADVRMEGGKKYGIIEFAVKEDAKKALKDLDDTRLDGVYVRVFAVGDWNKDDPVPLNQNKLTQETDNNNNKQTEDKERGRSRSRTPSRERSPSRSPTRQNEIINNQQTQEQNTQQQQQQQQQTTEQQEQKEEKEEQAAE